MKTIKAYYDGAKIHLIKPLPKSVSRKKSFVIMTFLEDDKEVKVPIGVKQGVLDLVKNNVYDLDISLDEI